MTLGVKDEVVSMVAADVGDSLLTICENGFGKRTSIDEYRKTRRGGKGVINIRATDRNGRVVAIKAVTDDDELMMITAKGMMLRTDLSAIREIGRATQGVRLIRIKSEDRVVAVAKMASEDADAETSNGSSPQDASSADAESNADQTPDDAQTQPPTAEPGTESSTPDPGE